MERIYKAYGQFFDIVIHYSYGRTREIEINIIFDFYSFIRRTTATPTTIPRNNKKKKRNNPHTHLHLYGKIIN